MQRTQKPHITPCRLPWKAKPTAVVLHTVALPPKSAFLTVRLLVARTGRRPSELLGLTAARVRDQEVAVVRHENVLDLTLGCLVHVLLVKSYDGLGDCLTDRVDLVQTKKKRRCMIDIRMLVKE